MAQKLKVIRNGQLVDPKSTQIRSDQVEKLKADRPPRELKTSESEKAKLAQKHGKTIYSAKKSLSCTGCNDYNPTPRMFIYEKSSKGPIILCEICDEDAEVRSFNKLDALDLIRKEFKVED